MSEDDQSHCKQVTSKLPKVLAELFSTHQRIQQGASIFVSKLASVVFFKIFIEVGEVVKLLPLQNFFKSYFIIRNFNVVV